MIRTNPAQTVSLSMRTNVFLGRREKAEQFVRLLESHGNVLVPEEFDIGEATPRWLAFAANRERAISELCNERYPGLVARRRAPVRLDYLVDSSRSSMFDTVDLTISNDWLSDRENLAEFVRFAKEAYRVTEASSGYIQNNRFERRYDRIETATPEGGITSAPRFPYSKNHLPGLFWANLFGPEYVEMWGASFLRQAPCERIETLPDGGVLLFLSEHPRDAGQPWYRERKEEVYEYLGHDAFDGHATPRFRVDDPWRKKRHARPLVQTGGKLDDVFAPEPDAGSRADGDKRET